MKTENKKVFLYALLILIVIIFIGFLGYYFGFLGTIYKVMVPQTFSKFNIITLSIIFGIAAFFSPCAFTVLPAYVSSYLTKQEKQKSNLPKLLKLGLFAALGIIVVNMVIGTAIAILGSATPFSKDPRTDIPLILGIRVVAGLRGTNK
jgi:cytochrome c biogenesis protein CcdA